MPYLFTPPQIIQTVVHPDSRALSWKFATSSTVWRIGGVWHYAFTPSAEERDGADYCFTGPVVVANNIATELRAAGIGILNHIT